MKRMKKLASLLMAVIMMFAMTITAFATETEPTAQTGSTAKDGGDFSIVLKDSKEGHTYSAYQVFKGDLMVVDYELTTPDLGGEDGEGSITENAGQSKILSNIEWGDNVDTDGLISEIKEISYMQGEETVTPFSGLSDEATAQDVANVLKDFENDSAAVQAFADAIFKKLTVGVPKTSDEYNNGVYTITGLTAGYYLVADNGELGEDPDAYSRYIMQVVADVEAKVKTEIPTIEKKIIEGDKKVDANNAGIGKVVSYEITGEVPETAGYDYYFYIITDTLSKGLTFQKDITVTVNGEKVFSQLDADTTVPKDVVSFEGVKNDDGTYTFELAFADIMKYKAGDKIVVNYTAIVNSEAEIGSTGNPNDVKLTYSNDPKHKYEGDKDGNKPGFPDKDKKPPFGETPKDTTITYVAEIEITKTDENSDPLQDVMFTLTGTSKQTVLVSRDEFVIDSAGEYWLLKDGNYTKTEPQVENMMVESSSSTSGYVVVTSDDKNTVGYDVSKEIMVKGVAYRPVTADDKKVTVYKLILANEDDYVSTVVKYKKVPVTETKEVTTTVNMVAVSDENGKIKFGGLGAGTYTITETGVPAGYNKADDVTVVIECEVPKEIIDGNEKATWILGSGTSKGVTLNSSTEDTESGKVSAATGLYETTIINKSGSLLPSTGGIGTTIFYVVGGILVIGAGILLVAKKRMGKN